MIKTEKILNLKRSSERIQLLGEVYKKKNTKFIFPFNKMQGHRENLFF